VAICIKECPPEEIDSSDPRRRVKAKQFFSPVVSRMLVEDYMRQLQDREMEDTYEYVNGQRKGDSAACCREVKATKTWQIC
jgi:hypothetical protein